jgi:hypothetical protein
MVYPPTLVAMMKQTPRVEPEATQMKGDIVSALYLDGKESEGVYVTGRDSNNCRPTAWVNLLSFDSHTMPRLETLGWHLITAGAVKRKVRLVLSYEGVAQQ